jgi:ATP-binding cassette subfamily B protein
LVALPQEGTIIRVGTHSELLATVPEYRELLSAYDAEQGDVRRVRGESGRGG